MDGWNEFIAALPAAGQQAGQIVSTFFYGPGIITAPILVLGVFFMAISIFTGRGTIGSDRMNEIKGIYLSGRGRGLWK